MKSKLIWAIPVAAFAAAMLGMALSGPSWATLSARTTALQDGGSTLTVGCDCCNKKQGWSLQNSLSGAGGCNGTYCARSAYPVNYFTGENLFSSDDLTATGFDNSSHARHYVTDSTYVEGAMGPGWRVGEGTLFDKGGGRIAFVDRSRHSRSFTQSGNTYTPDYFYKESLSQSTNGLFLNLVDEDGNAHTYYNTTYNNPVQLAGRYDYSADSQYVDGATGYTLTWTQYNIQSPPQYTSQLLTLNQEDVVGGNFDNTNYTYWYFSYGADPLFPSQLNVVLFQRVVNSATTLVRSANYTYYQSSGANGPAGALQRAVIQDPTGNIIETKYYRYNALDGNGRLPLRFVVEGPAYERLKVAAGGTDTGVDSASDATVALYANFKFTYNSNVAVTQEDVLGKGSITFSRTYSGFANDPNNWKCKTVEAFPNGDQNIVYTNYLAQPLLSIRASGANQWKTYKQFDSAGRVISEATPSAVVSYNDAVANLSIVLQSASGLIKLTNYASTTTATTTTPGDVAGYVQSRQTKKGSAGTPDTTESYTYKRHDATVYTVNRSVYPIASRTVYEGPAGATPRTTTYTYSWKTPPGATHESNLVDSMTTTYPSVATANNGSGSPTTTIQYYDNWKRPTWFMDEDGFIQYMEYDRVTGAVTKRIVDVNTANTGDFTGKPLTWTTPPGGGLHLKTVYQFDLMGRTIQAIDPSNIITWIVYKDINWETRVYPGEPPADAVIFRDGSDAISNAQENLDTNLSTSKPPRTVIRTRFSPANSITVDVHLKIEGHGPDGSEDSKGTSKKYSKMLQQ